jgi:hypothetical protein
MDYRSFGFLELQRGHSEDDDGLQFSIITPALRLGFQFECILTIIFSLVLCRGSWNLLMIKMHRRGGNERMTPEVKIFGVIFE